MAFKIKHIATRFLLQSIFTILIIATLIFIMFYSGFRKNDALKAVSITEEISSNLVIAGLNLDKAVDLQLVDPKFVESGCDALILAQNGIAKEIHDSVEILRTIKYLQPYLKKSPLDDSLNVSLRDYSISFSKVLLSLKEKGNQNGGLVKSASKTMEAVANELAVAPDNGIQATNFNSYTAAYFTDLSYSRLMDLITFCDEVVAPFYYIEGYDATMLESEVTSLRNTLLTIQKIDLRLLDPNKNEGQLVDLNENYDRLYSSYTALRTGVQMQTQRYNAWWNWVFTILALLLTAAYVIIMARFSTIVRKSVRGLHKITIALANGNIKDSVPEGGHYEFEAFNKDLKLLFKLLNSRKDFINKLLESDYKAELEVKAHNDLIGNALVQLQQKMLESQQEQDKYNDENKSRRYSNEGLAKFAEIMRVNSHDTSILTDVFIKELVKYMGAMQGGLFLTKEENPDLLVLSSTFAFDRKRYIEKTIKKGEGLVGTCAIERKTINQTEVPEGYITIKSGLGDTPPNNILLLPVMNEGELVGVIEMASLKVFREIEISLAESIAASLASTIITARNNSKTSELLKKSQQQAAEMAEQEEEMRQNMEELKATQEESARREDEMQGLLDAIGKSFYVLEYDLSGNIIHVNDRLLSFIEQSHETVVNKYHQDIFSGESLLSRDYLSNIIKNKQPVTVSETLNWGSKKYVYQYFLSPVLVANGEVLKVLNLFSIQEAEA